MQSPPRMSDERDDGLRVRREARSEFDRLSPLMCGFLMSQSVRFDGQSLYSQLAEDQLRRWARDHYVPPELRHPSWNPVFLREMARLDEEVLDQESRDSRLYSLVPLAPGDFYRIDPCQSALRAPKLLMTIPALGQRHYHQSEARSVSPP